VWKKTLKAEGGSASGLLSDVLELDTYVYYR
jgi:hypothetical protein